MKFCKQVVFFFLVFTVFSVKLVAQNALQYWHGKERTIRYHPEGSDIVITNGNKKFTRALYGSNTAFRIEAGDLPEFALYMPGMGGNIKIGIASKNSSKWLVDAASITARYRPGAMIYTITDPILNKGSLELVVLALANSEGMVIQSQLSNCLDSLELFVAYGGATGKKFSRDGDLGADPESNFYLKPAYCVDNHFTISNNSFLLNYGSGELLSEEDRYEVKHITTEKSAVKKNPPQFLNGIFPEAALLKIADANQLENPIGLFASNQSNTPVVVAKIKIENNTKNYFSIYRPIENNTISYQALANLAIEAELARKKIADRIIVNTPDAYINTLGAVLGIAADAIWEAPSYLHGSVGWRMRLNGWRGPYVADPLGWHERARLHFRSYALSQLTEPESGKTVADTALHLARQQEKLGTAVFSSGYISRNPGGDFKAHHYDMNLVFIDALLQHFKWTGDTAFMREMWPLIKRHLAWEKRNFDQDGDGLYDAYAAIWASDALQYSGGGVTHSSAYNYKANKLAATIALLLGEDARPFEKEATKIHTAINQYLWLPNKGWYAEYKDLLGLKKVHEQAALWTVYHSLDSEVPNAFQAYQTMQYVDAQIPHIPVRAVGLPNEFFTVSTSNWMPYTWSLNNVALAEVMHTTLAQWQAGKNETAFTLWKSALLESMYLGSSAGNIVQVSFYDAIRGETYRDFADPIAMTARSLVEGLFGIQPNAINHELVIKPGLPAAWNNASIKIPDINFSFNRNKQVDQYTIVPNFQKQLNLKFIAQATFLGIDSVLVNGKKWQWKNIDTAVGFPLIEIAIPAAFKYNIEIHWKHEKSIAALPIQQIVAGKNLVINFSNANLLQVFDPQQIASNIKKAGANFSANINSTEGIHTLFVQLKNKSFTWWQPIDFNIVPAISVIDIAKDKKNTISFQLFNNTDSLINGFVFVNGHSTSIKIPALTLSSIIQTPTEAIVPGTNSIIIKWANNELTTAIVNWNIAIPFAKKMETISLQPYLNDKLTQIFKNQYLSPRPVAPTLQLPTQGIGEWTYPLRTADINDSGLRKLAATNNIFQLPQGIPFSTNSDSSVNNIAFTSQWDNYPRSIKIPIAGNASHAYLLMAGSTNPMQSRFENGIVLINYMDGTMDSLSLKNPQTWWPIEQDYLEDGYAFHNDAAKPVRVHLKTGRILSVFDGTANEYNGKSIQGGAATVLDIPLNVTKPLKNLTLSTTANDVVIGLMSLTLIRDK